MQQTWTKAAGLVLAAVMASALTIGCEQQPEYRSTYPPPSHQQPQQWAQPEDGSSQQRAPAQEPAQQPDGNNAPSQYMPRPN